MVGTKVISKGIEVRVRNAHQLIEEVIKVASDSEHEVLIICEDDFDIVNVYLAMQIGEDGFAIRKLF